MNIWWKHNNVIILKIEEVKVFEHTQQQQQYYKKIVPQSSFKWNIKGKEE